MRQFFVLMSRNPISLMGVAITTVTALLIVTLFTIEALGSAGSSYLGIVTYLILPAIFLLGLGFIPFGIWRERRRMKAGDGRAPRFPVLDFNNATTRMRLLFFVLFTGINLVILSTATLKGVEVMESVEFCGTTCHTVMQPEHTAYERSPHSRVRCVECHIGPGAGWFVKSKLSGAWQVVSVGFNLYPQPISTPVHDLRPARDTCEQCHWPSKFVGDRLMVKTTYADDEPVTEQKTVVLLRVGGLEGVAGEERVDGRRSEGIHWHVDPAVQIRYRSDEKREEIYDIQLVDSDGTVKNYYRGGDPTTDPGDSEWRMMDCVDCHNRPSHIFQLPDAAVDEAINLGQISRKLPFARRESTRLLAEEYPSHDAAREGLAAGLLAYYRESYPDVAAEEGEAIATAGAALGTIYTNNVFPDMKVTWGTYPDHIGHETSPGCYRCHNDDHATEDGEVISQDCDTCHTVLAWAEENPAILGQLDP